MRLAQPIELLLGVLLALSYHRVHLGPIVERRAFSVISNGATDLAKTAAGAGKAGDAGKVAGGAGEFGKITANPAGTGPSAKPHGFAAPTEHSNSAPVTPRTPERQEPLISPSHSESSSAKNEPAEPEHYVPPVHSVHSIYNPKLIDIIQPTNDVDFLILAQKVKEERGLFGSLIHNSPGTNPSRLTTPESSPPHSPKKSEPGSPVRPSSPEIKEVEPHVPPTTSTQGKTSPKHVESEHSTNSVKSGSSDELTNDINPSPISKLNFLFAKVNTKYLKKIQTKWKMWMQQIFHASSGSSVKTSKEAEKAVISAMNKIRPNRGTTATSSRPWRWLQSLGRKFTDSLFGEEEKPRTLRALRRDPDSRTERQIAADAKALNKILEKVGNLLDRPPDKLDPVKLKTQFLEMWKNQLSKRELKSPEVIAEMEETSKKFLEEMKAVLPYAQGKRTLNEFADGVKKWRKDFLAELSKVLADKASETVGTSAKTTQQALEKLGRLKLTQELEPKVASIVDKLSPEQQEIMVKGLSTQKKYAEKIFRPGNDPSQNLHQFLQFKITEYTPDDIQAFSEARAGQQKSQISKNYKKTLFGQSEDPQRDALAELTAENLMKVLSTEVDLPHEFYLYRLIKGYEEALEPLKKSAADYLRVGVKRDLESVLSNPQKTGSLPYIYEQIVNRIAAKGNSKGFLFDKLFKDALGVKQTPEQLTAELKNPRIKDQIAKLASLYPNQLTPREIEKLQAAAELSPERYSKALEEIAKPVAERFEAAYLKKLPPGKDVPEVLKSFREGKPAVILDLEKVTKDSAAAQMIPPFLDHLQQLGLLKTTEKERLISAARVSYSHYLDEIGEIPSEFEARMHARIDEKLEAPLNPAEKEKIMNKAVDEIVQDELELLDVDVKETYLDPKAIVEHGHSQFVEAAKLYEKDNLDSLLTRLYDQDIDYQLQKYATSHVYHTVSPSPLLKPQPRIGESAQGISIGPQNSAIESEFFNELKIPDNKDFWGDISQDNPVSKIFDPRYMEFYHNPLKVGDRRLVGTRFEKLNAQAIRELNGQAAAIRKNINVIFEADSKVNAGKAAVGRYQQELGPYDQLITHVLETITSKYVLENKVWKVAEPDPSFG